MKSMKPIIWTLLAVSLLGSIVLLAHTKSIPNSDENQTKNEDKLVVLWTSGDRDLAIKMAFMYTYNAKKNKWWDDILLIIWGPSSKLLSTDQELQDYVKKMMDEGVIIKACKACADMYSVSQKIEDLGIEVKYLGMDLTEYMKAGRHILTL